MRKRHRKLSAPLAVGFAMMIAQAATTDARGEWVVLEDAEVYSPAQNVTSGWSFRNGSPAYVTATSDTGELFDSGTDNLYLLARTWADNWGAAGLVDTSYGFALGSGTLATFEFEAVVEADDWLVRFAANVDPWTTGSWGGSGNLATSAELGRLMTISILYNRSGATQTFYNPLTKTREPLASPGVRAFRYLHDNKTYADLGGTVYGNGTPTRLWFMNTAADSVTEYLRLDNIRWNSGVLQVNQQTAPFTLLSIY